MTCCKRPLTWVRDCETDIGPTPEECESDETEPMALDANDDIAGTCYYAVSDRYMENTLILQRTTVQLKRMSLSDRCKWPLAGLGHVYGDHAIPQSTI